MLRFRKHRVPSGLTRASAGLFCGIPHLIEMASSPPSYCRGVKIAPEMESQDKNYMPGVVSYVSHSHGKIFIMSTDARSA